MNQQNTTDQAGVAGIDLDKLDYELDSILTSLTHDHRSSIRESVRDIRAMVAAARKAAEPKSVQFCSKLESPCGDDPWGWCQSCPKRAAQQATEAAAAIAPTDEKALELSFRSIDDGPEFEALLFAYRDTKFITGQMRDIIAYANDWLQSGMKAHVKRIRQLERELATATAPVETASDALTACINYIAHGKADFAGMKPSLVAYFQWKVAQSMHAPKADTVSQASGAWQLLPVALTEDMLVAFAEAWYSKQRCIDDCEMDDAYAALLAAAPTPSFYYDARTGFTAVADQLVNEMQLYFEANANVSDECSDFYERLTRARAAGISNPSAQPESGSQGLPPIGERESIMDVCGLPKLMRDILESKGSPDSLGKLYDFITAWGYARFNFGQRTASEELRGTSAAEPVFLSLNDKGLVTGYLTQGWTFEYDPETCYVELIHPRGGNQSICEVLNDDTFGYAIAAALNNAVYPTAEDVRPSDTWRVGEFWSSGSPGTKVLMLSRGAEIASHEKHESFIRWVGASGIHARASKTAG